MKEVDTSTLELDHDTLLYAANDLWQELKGIEQHYPQVLNDETYRGLQQTCISYAYGILTQPQFEELYAQLMQCLQRIAATPTNVVSLSARRDRPKSLADYLPKTFKDFVDKVTEAKLQAEYHENAYEGAAEALFMNEIEGGIDAIVPRHREEVKDRIFEILLENTSDDEDIKEIDKVGVDRILQLMGIEDEWELMAAGIDQQCRRIAEIIIFIREEIATEYIDSDKEELKLKKVSPEAFEAFGTGMQKLFLAMAQRESECGSAKELKKAHRMEFARRIIMPQLKVADDSRSTVAEAKNHGLTSLEIKVLLMSGYLKIAPDELLGHHDPDTPIEGMEGVTLGDIETRALAHAATMRGKPDPGRAIH